MTIDPLAKQEGGKHYKGLAIQPVEYVMANKLGFCEGNVIKYVTRHQYKNGKEDLKKAIHFLEFLIKEYEDNERNGQIRPEAAAQRTPGP